MSLTKHTLNSIWNISALDFTDCQADITNHQAHQLHLRARCHNLLLASHDLRKRLLKADVSFFSRFYWIYVVPTICLCCLSLSCSVICYDDAKIYVAVEVFCVPYTLSWTIKVAGGWWEVWQRYSPPSVTATSDIRRFQFWGKILYQWSTLPE